MENSIDERKLAQFIEDLMIAGGTQLNPLMIATGIKQYIEQLPKRESGAIAEEIQNLKDCKMVFGQRFYPINRKNTLLDQVIAIVNGNSND